MKPRDFTGETFGRLTVIGLHDHIRFPSGSMRYRWLCHCVCGTERVILGSNLRRGTSTSCGCAFREIVTKHGGAIGYGQTPEYSVWLAMRGRCLVGKSGGFKNYGARGISVCVRWNDFRNFLEDMGKRPSLKHSIERIDNNGNYEPGNCRWATNSEQQWNKRTNRNNTSGVMGVTFSASTNLWTAQIKLRGRMVFLGRWETKEQATIAAVAARRVREELEVAA